MIYVPLDELLLFALYVVIVLITLNKTGTNSIPVNKMIVFVYVTIFATVISMVRSEKENRRNIYRSLTNGLAYGVFAYLLHSLSVDISSYLE